MIKEWIREHWILCLLSFILGVLLALHPIFALGTYGTGDTVYFSAMFNDENGSSITATSVGAYVFDPDDTTPKQISSLSEINGSHVGFFRGTYTIPSSPLVGEWIIVINGSVAGSTTETPATVLTFQVVATDLGDLNTSITDTTSAIRTTQSTITTNQDTINANLLSFRDESNVNFTEVNETQGQLRGLLETLDSIVDTIQGYVEDVDDGGLKTILDTVLSFRNEHKVNMTGVTRGDNVSTINIPTHDNLDGNLSGVVKGDNQTCKQGDNRSIATLVTKADLQGNTSDIKENVSEELEDVTATVDLSVVNEGISTNASAIMENVSEEFSSIEDYGDTNWLTATEVGLLSDSVNTSTIKDYSLIYTKIGTGAIRGSALHDSAIETITNNISKNLTEDHSSGSWATAIGFKTGDNQTCKQGDNHSISALLTKAEAQGNFSNMQINLTYLTNGSLVDAVWDEILTGATHNIATSAGKRLREVSGYVIHTGTALGGNGYSINFSVGASDTDDIYNRNLIVILAGTGAGQTRTIVDYNATTKVSVVDRDWKVTPDDTSEYSVVADDTPLVVNHGIAQGGSSTSITLHCDSSSITGTYIGSIVNIMASTGKGEARIISAYDGATKIATVTPAWTTTPDATSIYVVMPYGQSMICKYCGEALTELSGELVPLHKGIQDNSSTITTNQDTINANIQGMRDENSENTTQLNDSISDRSSVIDTVIDTILSTILSFRGEHKTNMSGVMRGDNMSLDDIPTHDNLISNFSGVVKGDNQTCKQGDNVSLSNIPTKAELQDNFTKANATRTDIISLIRDVPTLTEIWSHASRTLTAFGFITNIRDAVWSHELTTGFSANQTMEYILDNATTDDATATVNYDLIGDYVWNETDESRFLSIQNWTTGAASALSTGQNKTLYDINDTINMIEEYYSY